MSIIKTGTVVGAIFGAGLAIALTSLDQTRPFSPNTNAFIDRAVFAACPLYVLGFSNSISSLGAVIALTIMGTAVLYGLAFCVLATLYSLGTRVIARK